MTMWKDIDSKNDNNSPLKLKSRRKQLDTCFVKVGSMLANGLAKMSTT